MAAVRERGYSLCGTVDSVARQRERVIETLRPEMLVPWMAVGPAPIEGLLKSNELLVEKVLPLIGVSLDRFEPTLRRDVVDPTWRTQAG